MNDTEFSECLSNVWKWLNRKRIAELGNVLVESVICETADDAPSATGSMTFWQEITSSCRAEDFSTAASSYCKKIEKNALHGMSRKKCSARDEPRHLLIAKMLCTGWAARQRTGRCPRTPASCCWCKRLCFCRNQWFSAKVNSDISSSSEFRSHWNDHTFIFFFLWKETGPKRGKLWIQQQILSQNLAWKFQYRYF